jgi:hypothetical protein
MCGLHDRRRSARQLSQRVHMTAITAAFDNDEADLPGLLVIAAVGAVVSILTTGFMVGVRNDLYYLPIVRALYNEPQFAADSFIQSLRYFSAGPWILLKGAASRFDPYWILLGLNFLSRFLSFIGFLACADILGLRQRSERALFAALLCTTPLLRGQSLAGDGGLFINYFTHSEIDNGLTLILLFLLIRCWLASALIVNGLVFFINAFMGVWDAAMTIAVTGVLLLHREINLRNAAWRCSLGLMVAAILAVPVLMNVLENPDFGRHFDFDYVVFLEQFWPYHFIFRDIAGYEKIGLVTLVVLGAVAFHAFGRPARLFLVAMAAFSTVYVVGIIAPYLTHSALVLNLHLLRVSSMLQQLAVLGSLALATSWWLSERPLYAKVSAPILVLALCTPIRMTSMQPAINSAIACAVIGISCCRGQEFRAWIPEWLLNNRFNLRHAAAALVAVGFAVIVANSVIKNERGQAWLNEWIRLANWANANTRPADLFILPTWNFLGHPNTEPGTVEDDAILTSGEFEAVSHRSVWIDFRNGAAVMWSPSYYEEWQRRVAEVNSLTSFAAKVGYARTNGISYIVDVCTRYPAIKPVFSTQRLCVYSTVAGVGSP